MRILVFALMFLGTVSISFGAKAELSMAVVDVQALLTRSDAAKSIQTQVQKHREAFLKEISDKEKTLRDQEAKLIEEGKSLEKEELLKRRKDFEAKFVETQTMAKKRKAVIDKAYAKAMSTLMDRVYEAVQGVADEKGHTLVISRQNVVIGAQSLDITEDSLKALNKAVSKIDLVLKDQ